MELARRFPDPASDRPRKCRGLWGIAIPVFQKDPPCSGRIRACATGKPIGSGRARTQPPDSPKEACLGLGSRPGRVEPSRQRRLASWGVLSRRGGKARAVGQGRAGQGEARQGKARQGRAEAIRQRWGDEAFLSFWLIASALPHRWSHALPAELRHPIAFARRRADFREGDGKALGRQAIFWEGYGKAMGRPWEGRRFSGKASGRLWETTPATPGGLPETTRATPGANFEGNLGITGKIDYRARDMHMVGINAHGYTTSIYPFDTPNVFSYTHSVPRDVCPSRRF